MKRVVFFLVALFLLLSACSPSEKTGGFDIESFSYADDYAYYKDDPGVKLSEFINNVGTKVSKTEQVVELAKNECTVVYDTIDVAHDTETGIYRISFYKEGWGGGNQDVYINQEGITQMIVYGE